jgi:integrase
VKGAKVDAERRLTQLLREHDVTGIVPDREATVASFSRTWLDHVGHRIKPTTLKRYRELLLVHVLPAIGPIHMTELRPAAVQAVVTKVLEIRSPRTAVNVYRVLSEMLGEAVRWGVIASNPASAIRPPRAPRSKLHVPDQETCAAILERVRDRQVEGPVVLSIGTGMRLGEILGLQWRNVDLDRKVLRVGSTMSVTGGEFTLTAPKTARARRSIDLPPFVGFLRRHRKEQNERKLAFRDVWAITTWSSTTASGSRCRRGRSARTSAAWSPNSDYRGRGFTISDTRTRRNCSRTGCRSRSCPSGSGTRARRSRWTPTRP